MESTSKEYVNLYRSDPLATSKQQRAEDRDKRRHLAYKFSVSPSNELAWHGQLYGSGTPRIDVLRRGLLALESSLAAPFVRGAWHGAGHSDRWTRTVRQCATPRDFATALAEFAACIKPVVFNAIWRDAIGLYFFVFFMF